MSRYIVKVATVPRGGARFGDYGRVAVVELAPGHQTACRIDERLPSVLRVVRTWERLHWGKTEKCALRVAIKEAESLAERLNAEQEQS